MGTTIANLVNDADDLTFVGGVDIREGSLLGQPVYPSTDIRTFLEDMKPDVLIDFTIAHAAVENIIAGAEAGVALWSAPPGSPPRNSAHASMKPLLAVSLQSSPATTVSA